MANKYWNIPSTKSNKDGDSSSNELIATLDYLDMKGKQMISSLVNEKDYQTRTGNLVSSYAYGVFYNGGIMRQGRVKDVSTEKGTYGIRASTEITAEMEKRLQKADATKIVFVVFAAVFYGGILEHGEAPLKRKYLVIKDIIRNEIYGISGRLKGITREYG